MYFPITVVESKFSIEERSIKSIVRSSKFLFSPLQETFDYFARILDLQTGISVVTQEIDWVKARVFRRAFSNAVGKQQEAEGTATKSTGVELRFMQI